MLACDDGTLRSLSADTGEFGWTLATGALSARAVALASDSGPVVAAFPDGSVRRYDLVAGTSDIVGTGLPAHLVTITPDGNVVVAAGAGGVLLRWEPPLGALPDSRALGTAITAAAVDGTGDKVLVGTDNGRLWLHDLTGGPEVEFAAPAYPSSGVDAIDSSGIAAIEPPLSPHRGIVDNDVRFTVYRPQVLSPGVWASLLVFAHKTTLVVEPGRAPVDPNEQVEAIARAHFGDTTVRPVGEDARSGLSRGAQLRIVPDLPGIRCNPGDAEFHWWEPVHDVMFRLLAGPDLVGSVVRGAVRFWCGPLLLGEVSLAISIAASGSAAESPLVTESAPRYRKIFPSYSHSDRAVVEGFADAARALGDQYLQDVLSLRAGERWETRLLELIEDADVFQLFWSSNSMRSPYCRGEWEYALALRRPSFVRPLYWEEPLPEDPVKGLPPVALRELHFVKVAQAAPRQASTPGPGISAPPDLLVRTRRSVHQMKAGTIYHIGRDPKYDIVMTDSRVSWRHAVVRVDGAGWVIEDLGSTNGTFLGLQRLDRIEIGAVCVVRLGNPDDGPVLRCMLQVPVAAAPPTGAPPADHPGTALSVSPAPAAPEAAPCGNSESWWQPTPEAGSVSRPPGVSSRSPAPEPIASREPAPRHAMPGAAAQSAQPVAPDLLPSVDRRPTARMPLPAKAMRIGRAPDNELVLSDLNTSRHHAELRKSSTGSYEIVDLDSHNGTFVNGQRVSRQVLTEQDLVSIGSSTFRLKDGELRQFVDDGLITFTAQDLVVKVGGGKVLLDHVTFPIPEKCLLGVIGPSGAGKSTLLGALTGMRPADTGTVLYDNRDLYANYNELRYRIGLVPQESVLHTQLTARRALQYAAELRFPADTKPAERDGRVNEVMTELGLTRHANTRADRLSGGQLKRVNVAQELLTKPSLLFLDEPTSGLDPGLDKSVMEQMRDLAHDGRTVIVVTHSVDNLDTCDRLLVLVPGGRIAFYGPPDEGLAYFGQSRWAEVFQAFERYPDRDWAAEFAGSPAYAQYVMGRPKPQPVPNSQELAPTPPPQRRGGFSQMTTLTRRYVRVIAADRGYLMFTALLPVILGTLISLVQAKEGLAGAFGTNGDAETLLLILVICACLAGMASSVREVVKERSIYVRERAAGLSSGAYLASKLLVLGVICIVQSAVLVLIGVAWRPMPAHGAFLTGAPLIELILGIALLAVASMCLGLFVSAIVSTSEKATPFLVLFTMVQVILVGAVVPLGKQPGLSQLAWLAPSRWGFSAVASTVNLDKINPPVGAISDPLWTQTSTNWLRDMGIMIGLAAAFTLLAWIRLRRLGPRRRKG